MDDRNNNNNNNKEDIINNIVQDDQVLDEETTTDGESSGFEEFDEIPPPPPQQQQPPEMTDDYDDKTVDVDDIPPPPPVPPHLAEGAAGVSNSMGSGGGSSSISKSFQDMDIAAATQNGIEKTVNKPILPPPGMVGGSFKSASTSSFGGSFKASSKPSSFVALNGICGSLDGDALFQDISKRKIHASSPSNDSSHKAGKSEDSDNYWKNLSPTVEQCIDDYGKMETTIGKQYQPSILVEALEVEIIRQRVLPFETRRELLELFESVDFVDTISKGSGKAYEKLEPVLNKLPKENIHALNNICALVRSSNNLGQNAMDMMAEWCGRYILLWVDRNSSMKAFRTIQTARDLMKILIQNQGLTELEKSPGGVSIHSSDASPESTASSKRKPGYRKFFSTIKTRIKGHHHKHTNETDHIDETDSSKPNNNNNNNTHNLKAVQQIDDTNTCFDQDLSIDDYNELLETSPRTVQELIHQFGRPPPPPPPMSSETQMGLKNENNDDDDVL